MPCILTPTNLIGVSRHYTVYPLIVQVNLFCGGGMGLFCERGTSFWRKNSPSRALPQESRLRFPVPPRKAPGRMRLAGNDGAFFARGGLLSGERTPPLALPPPRKPLGFSCPAAQRARRDGCAFQKTQQSRIRRPLRAADAARRFPSEGGPGGTLPFSKGRVPPERHLTQILNV